MNKIEAYWGDLYEKTVHFKRSTPAIEAFVKYCERNRSETLDIITVSENDVKKAFKNTKNFSAPGPDGICNYWWKNLPSVHKHLTSAFTRIIIGNMLATEWLVVATTTLIYKKGDPAEPSNYRPITCLNTIYKVFTKVLYEKILRQINPIWTNIHEQKGAKKGVAGCQENLNIDRCICDDARKYKRHLSMAWVDYRKAFDSTPHDLILFVLKTLNVDIRVVNCIEGLMRQWKTRFKVQSNNKIVLTRPIRFERGVFQGDSLSPLLFCLTLIPLSIQLRKHRGYSCGKPNQRTNSITHLLYMDDLKIYMANKDELEKALNDVLTYSTDICMKFGVEKCATLHIQRGTLENQETETELINGAVIQNLQQNQSYTYLGIEENNMQHVKSIKNKLTNKYRKVLKKIWDSQLSAKNKIMATNMLAVPQLSFTFGIIKWNIDELKQLDRYTRKIMTSRRSHHPRASVPRVYISRQGGGRGLLSIESLHHKIIIKTYHSILNSTDPLIKIVQDHEQQGSFLSTACMRASEYLDLGIRINTNNQKQNFKNMTVKELEKIINTNEQRLKDEHMSKVLHGTYFRGISENRLSIKLSFQWLRSSTLRSETEGYLAAVQDGVINTLLYRKTILKQNIEDIRCRRCHESPESLNHLLASCPPYAATAYITRHNAALKVLYFHLRHYYGIDEEPIPSYAVEDVESVCTNGRVKIYWNFPFATSRQIQANKPDLVIEDLIKKTWCIVEFSCPLESNIQQKESEKKQKYKDLIFELKKRNPRTKINLVVIIIGVLGGVKDNMCAAIKTIPGCDGHEERLFKSMQKQVILGSLRLLRGHEATYA